MSCQHVTPARTESSNWLDDLSRRQLSDGSFAALVRDRHVRGATLSLAAFAKTLVDSDVYLPQIQELALREVSADEALRALIAYDARWACDVLQEVYVRSSGVDGRICVDLDPRSAHDTDRIVAEAKALWWLVDRPNLVVGIAATRPGLSAITACLAEGISVNATQICSRTRYADVLPEHDEAQQVEDDSVAVVNTAWYQLDLELGKALHSRGRTP
ncbi:hypothetical protein G7043_39980 [Lentzea sp. NEAU-D13]|uniref:Transaldolase n=1 Tax=Lentzea alba TaxID=2714351 RepID=A0A7C9RYC1_9PSEU|nr:transaldolase family protein [Lentzea alba]NGY65106.1 hypothetical protein [Lentzea alba]